MKPLKSIILSMIMWLLPLYAFTQGPNTIKDYFRTNQWNYPLEFKLGDTIKWDKAYSGGDTNEHVKMRIKELQTYRDSLYRYVKRFIVMYRDTDRGLLGQDSTYGIRIFYPEFHSLNPDTVCLSICTNFYYHSNKKLKVENNDVFWDVFRKVIDNDYIYVKRCWASFIISRKSISFLEWVF